MGKKGGRRPAQYRVPKADMGEVIGQLYKMGFGCQIVARMLGYSGAQIHMYARDFGLTPAGPQVKADTMVSLMPDGLRSAIGKIRMRSNIAHERKRQPVASYTHLLVDDPD